MVYILQACCLSLIVSFSQMLQENLNEMESELKAMHSKSQKQERDQLGLSEALKNKDKEVNIATGGKISSTEPTGGILQSYGDWKLIGLNCI